MTKVFPFLSVPVVGRINDERDRYSQRIDLAQAENQLAIVLGSDLILATEEGSPDRVAVFVSDANHLSTLAVLGDGVTLADVLPHLIQVARTMYPNHLITPLP